MAHKLDIQITADNHSRGGSFDDNGDEAVRSTEQIPAADKMARAERRPRKPRILQPLDTLSVPGARLRIGTVEVLVGLKRSAIYNHIKDGRFPGPVKHGARCARWNSDAIRAYLAGSAQ